MTHENVADYLVALEWIERAVREKIERESGAAGAGGGEPEAVHHPAETAPRPPAPSTEGRSHLSDDLRRAMNDADYPGPPDNAGVPYGSTPPPAATKPRDPLALALAARLRAEGLLDDDDEDQVACADSIERLIRAPAATSRTPEEWAAWVEQEWTARVWTADEKTKVNDLRRALLVEAFAAAMAQGPPMPPPAPGPSPAAPLTPELREPVRRFAETMEQRLRANDHKGGWTRCEVLWLLGRLREEVEELEREILRGEPAAIVHEAADVANFAMMIADRSTAGVGVTETWLRARAAAIREGREP